MHLVISIQEVVTRSFPLIQKKDGELLQSSLQENLIPVGVQGWELLT